jgi:proteasome lid subunit RPN8/RPN11
MADCFAEQMKILQEPRYAKAMAAATPEDYILEECKVWSTGLQKGQQVLSIYHLHIDLLN